MQLLNEIFNLMKDAVEGVVLGLKSLFGLDLPADEMATVFVSRICAAFVSVIALLSLLVPIPGIGNYSDSLLRVANQLWSLHPKEIGSASPKR